MRKLFIALLSFFAFTVAYAQGAAQPVPPSVVPGAAEDAVLPDMRIRLVRVIRPGASNSVGGTSFTEYAFRVTNTLPDRELRLSDVAVTVAGDVRRPPQSAGEIMNLDQTAEEIKTRTEGLGLLRLAASFIPGLGGVVAGHAGMAAGVVNRQLTNEQMAAPEKWGAELAARSFKNIQGGAVTILPGETASGSVWIKQAASERGSLLQFFAKAGGDGVPRLVRIGIADNEMVAESNIRSSANQPQ